jgi:hypothetical protein
MIAWHHGNGEALARLLFDVDPGAPPASTPDPFEVRMRDLKAALIEGLPVDEARRPASTMSRSRGSSSGSWRGSRRARSRPMP